MNEHHKIFKQFKAFEGDVPTDFEVDFIGSKKNKRYLQEFNERISTYILAQPPIFDEEYFEWIDVLESVALAGDSYTIVELGAGYGRWAVIGALAAKQRRIQKINIIAVEAEPTHFKWLQEHLDYNGLKKEQYKIYDYVVGADEDEVDFYVEMPKGYPKNTPREWYGQSKSKIIPDSSLWRKFKAVIKKVLMKISGLLPINRVPYLVWKTIKVQQMPLNYFISEYNLVDLVDMDVQGEEFEVVRGSIEELNKKVKRLHIGTHSKSVEISLTDLLTKNGWQCVNNYSTGTEYHTTFGKINFGDGVQTWINPRLIE